MSNNYTKTLVAVTLIAVLATALVPVFAEDSDAAIVDRPVSVDDVGVCNYSIYLQLDNGKDSFDKDLGKSTQTSITAESYVSAVKELCDRNNIDVDITKTGELKSLKADGVEYKAGAQTGYGFSIYYLTDDCEWKLSTTYDESETFTLVYGEIRFTETEGFVEDPAAGCWRAPSDVDVGNADLTFLWTLIGVLIAFGIVIEIMKKTKH